MRLYLACQYGHPKTRMQMLCKMSEVDCKLSYIENNTAAVKTKSIATTARFYVGIWLNFDVFIFNKTDRDMLGVQQMA